MTSTSDYYQARAASEQALMKAATDHAAKHGAAAFLLPVEGSTRTMFLAFGTADQLRDLLEGVDE